MERGVGGIKRKALILVVLLLLFAPAAAGGCAGGKGGSGAGPGKVSLTVSAATSLKDPLEDLKAIYGGQNPGVPVTLNFGSSGSLQRQIEEGAPVDLFISADQPQMDALEKKGLIVEASRRDLLANELVLIAGKESRLEGFGDLAGGGSDKIAIGVPETVPAGRYARETLTSLGIWEKIQPRLVLAGDVRQVLAFVETGSAGAGLVYRTDAGTGKGIKIVAAAPPGTHRPIVYPLAVVKGTKHREEAEKFALFLSGGEAAGVFEKYGFKVIK